MEDELKPNHQMVVSLGDLVWMSSARLVFCRSRLFVAFGDGLRMDAAKPRRAVALASLRSEPEHDGGGVAEERSDD